METNVARETGQNCIFDLNLSYSRSAGRRFARLLEVREQNKGKQLTKEEILDIYRKFDSELKKSLPMQTV
jgi:hypothetical protein